MADPGSGPRLGEAHRNVIPGPSGQARVAFGARPAELFLVCGLLALLLTGCTTRSISDSGYRGGYGGRHPFYRGELSELDVLGLDAAAGLTDAQIQERLASYKPVHLPRGARLLVIQSGAFVPDASMLEAVNRSYTAVPFSGQPGSTNGVGFARALRLAAAQAGCEAILCCWGALESAVQPQGTKAVSWVPIVGGAFPDETQWLRLRLKLVVVDTRTGDWATRSPEPVTSKSLSAKLNREAADQGQVERLKRRGYELALDDLAGALTPR